MTEEDKNKLRQYLKFTVSLLDAMDAMLQAERPDNFWKYGGYKQFARKYMQIINLVIKEIERPPILDFYNIEKMPDGGNTLPYQQKEVFESIYANLSLLRAFLETEIGVVDDEILVLRDFLQSRLRSAIFKPPEREKDIQDVIEQLLIGRGMQKGQDYDREVGRVKFSAKEAVPDFIVLKFSLAIEVKFVKNAGRVREIIDEISADIASYAKKYRQLLFLIYDLGHIRDESEFRYDLENAPNVSVVVIKH